MLSLGTFVNVSAQELKFEAESAQIVSSEVISGDQYSGGEAVRMTENRAKLTFTIDVASREKFTVFVKAEGIGGEKVVNCSVNGTMSNFKTNELSEVEVGTFMFKSGHNTLEITPSWKWYNVDYVRIVPNSSEVSFSISDVPVTADATEAAQRLYTLLHRNFGFKTLSGMMTGDMGNTDGLDITRHEDVVAVYKASGFYPALVGFDFLFATGRTEEDGWCRQYTDRIISLAKDLWQRGGVPDFSWHWHDPSRKTDDFYTDKTSFNFTTAMNADGSWNAESETYKNLIHDIDRIADRFLELQEAGAACIFRPLHEAPGGWFWWGTQGPDAFAALYRLIVDEMTKVKGVRNVLFDWNADPNLGLEWSPGEEYYDIISTDIYNRSYDYSSNYPAFDKLKKLSGGKKLITLAENGPIPDISKMADEGAMWCWWMPWYQSWNGNFVNQTKKDEWQKCMSDERVMTLEDMPGWDVELSLDAVETVSGQKGCYSLSGYRTFDAKGLLIKDGRTIFVK